MDRIGAVVSTYICGLTGTTSCTTGTAGRPTSARPASPPRQGEPRSVSRPSTCARQLLPGQYPSTAGAVANRGRRGPPRDQSGPLCDRRGSPWKLVV